MSATFLKLKICLNSRFSTNIVILVIEKSIHLPCWHCYASLQPGGSIFFTTINKNWLSYALAIVGAERLCRITPQGTHDWTKFVDPKYLENLLMQSRYLYCHLLVSFIGFILTYKTI